MLQHRPRTAIERRTSFSLIRYANCWEDADVLKRGLAPLAGARCLSIASAGDNTLSLLADGAAFVLAVDLSGAQLALLELKMAAFRALSHEDLLRFLGVRDCGERIALYHALRPALGSEARAFWDVRGATINRGVIHCGRLEAYFRVFRRCVLPLIHRRATVEALFEPRPRVGRERFYADVWDNRRWRTLVRLFFSRRVMGALGRDPEFFRYTDSGVGEWILERARYAFTALPTHDNPYLRYILTGNFGPCLPDYLRPERHPAIREGLPRIRSFHGPVEEAAARLAPGSIDAFSLSDVAEYMDVPDYHALLDGLRRVAAPGARFAYWNLLASRQRPDSMREWLSPQRERATELGSEARAFFYRAFVLEVAQ